MSIAGVIRDLEELRYELGAILDRGFELWEQANALLEGTEFTSEEHHNLLDSVCINLRDACAGPMHDARVDLESLIEELKDEEEDE